MSERDDMLTRLGRHLCEQRAYADGEADKLVGCLRDRLYHGANRWARHTARMALDVLALEEAVRRLTDHC